MKPDLLPHERDEWLSTRAPLQADPQSISPAEIEGHRRRQRRLLNEARTTYGPEASESPFESLHGLLCTVLRFAAWTIGIAITAAIAICIAIYQAGRA